MDLKNLAISLGVCLLAVVVGSLIYDLTIRDAVTRAKSEKDIE